MKKYLYFLTFICSLLSISCESDYEKQESNFTNKLVTYTIKDSRDRIIKGADVYLFSEINYTNNSYSENILEFANEKQRSNTSGVVIFEDLFSKLIEGDNTEINRFTFIVVYTSEGVTKKQVYSEVFTKDYLNINNVIVCD